MQADVFGMVVIRLPGGLQIIDRLDVTEKKLFFATCSSCKEQGLSMLLIGRVASLQLTMICSNVFIETSSRKKAPQCTTVSSGESTQALVYRKIFQQAKILEFNPQR